MVAKFNQLVAALYAGGYRFLAVFLVDYFSPQAISADFSRYFFWAGLIAVIAGVPVAARAQAKGMNLTHGHQVLLSAILLTIAVPFAFFFWQDSLEDFVLMIASGFLLSLFEIKRMERASEGRFGLLTLCSIVSLVALIAVTSFMQLSAGWLTVAIFAGLSLPLGFSYIIRPYTIKNKLPLEDAYKPVAANAFSSLLSTGLTFIVPLLLIEEFGREHSVHIAQAFAISTVAFSLPRYLSAGFIVAAKQGKATFDDVKGLAKKITGFAFLASGLFFLGSYFFAPEMVIFTALFVALQLSQSSLSYANWWMVHSQETKLLRLTIWSMLALAAAVAALFFTIPTGTERGEAMLIAFIGYQLLRFYMFASSKLTFTH